MWVTGEGKELREVARSCEGLQLLTFEVDSGAAEAAASDLDQRTVLDEFHGARCRSQRQRRLAHVESDNDTSYENIAFDGRQVAERQSDSTGCR